MQCQAKIDVSVQDEDTWVEDKLTMIQDMRNSVPITAANR